MTAPSRAGLRAGALFAGIGGFCRGFHQAGVPTAWAIEVDPFAVATYTQNFPDVTTLERDVQEVSVKTADLEPVDILHAGFPCQSFSQAGIRQGFQDPRGRLFFEIIRIIREFKDRQPKALVLENTPYLRYGEGGAWFLELQREIQTQEVRRGACSGAIWKASSNFEGRPGLTGAISSSFPGTQLQQYA